MMQKPIAIDLFCGAGGVSEGILQAGFHIIYSNEINSDAALTYRKRHEQLGLIQGDNTWLDVKDIQEITGKYIYKRINNLKNITSSIKKIDAIFGGPPCQGFSRAGKQNSNDERNILFREYLRIVYEVNPNYVIFENVLGILDVTFEHFISTVDYQIYKNVNALDIIFSELKKMGFLMLDYKILNAVDYGVPQNRKRVIVIGYKKGLQPPSYPKPNSKKISTKEALSDLYDLKVISNYQNESIKGRTKNINNNSIKSLDLYNMEKTNHSNLMKERFSLLRSGESLRQLRNRIKTDGIDLNGFPHLTERLCSFLNLNTKKVIEIFRNGSISEIELDILLTKKASQIKLNPNEPSVTVMTLPDDIISPFENRIFTVREMARLQSFDDSFVFYGKRTTGSNNRKIEVPQYSQVGNAVPPLLAKAIAEEIKNSIILNNNLILL